MVKGVFHNTGSITFKQNDFVPITKFVTLKVGLKQFLVCFLNEFSFITLIPKAIATENRIFNNFKIFHNIKI